MPVYAPKGLKLLSADTLTADQTISNTSDDGASFSPAFGGSFVSTGGLLIVQIRLGLIIPATSWGGVTLRIDSTTIGPTLCYAPGTHSDVWPVSGISAGSHTFEVRGRKDGSAGDAPLLASVAPCQVLVFEAT